MSSILVVSCNSGLVVFLASNQILYLCLEPVEALKSVCPLIDQVIAREKKKKYIL